MLPSRFRFLCGLVALLLTACVGAQETPEPPKPDLRPVLLPGMPAPKVKVAEWLAGNPVEDFKPNKVYVLEFFRSRSKPCRNFASNFQKMSEKYRKKATFVSFSVWENDQADVTPYVKELGSRLGYSIATDSQANPKDHFGFMTENWLNPAGLTFPSVIIVGKDQTIAWMGNADESEPVLNDIVNGKWDVNAFATKAKAKADELRSAEEAWRLSPVHQEIQKISGLIRAGESEEALKEIDTLVTMDPKDARTNPIKYGAYARVMIYAGMQDLDGFYGAAAQLYDACADDADLLNNTAWVIVDPKSEVPEKHWDLAIKLATRAVEVSKRNSSYCLDTLAWAFYGNGDKEKAIAAEQEAIKVSDDLDQEKGYQDNLKVFHAKAV